MSNVYRFTDEEIRIIATALRCFLEDRCDPREGNSDVQSLLDRLDRGATAAMSDVAQTEIDIAFGHLRDLIASKGKLSGCTSYCQRKMQIGYNRASGIMEVLEEQQFITAPDKVGIRQPGPAWWALQEN